MLHGSFEIGSAAMKGTQITVSIPPKAAHDKTLISEAA
jgi:hypothetical protein